MIQTRKDLQFYIIADRVMNGFPAKSSLRNKVKDLILGGGQGANS